MPPRPAPAVKTGPRVGMIIVGIVIALIGAWIIAASSGFMVDEQLALILILALGGLTLIVSALIAAWRRPKA
jgi:putative Ca2+/H+ antiporter (TMEM165/GDT1 family)